MTIREDITYYAFTHYNTFYRPIKMLCKSCGREDRPIRNKTDHLCITMSFNTLNTCNLPAYFPWSCSLHFNQIIQIYIYTILLLHVCEFRGVLRNLHTCTSRLKIVALVFSSTSSVRDWRKVHLSEHRITTLSLPAYYCDSTASSSHGFFCRLEAVAPSSDDLWHPLYPRIQVVLLDLDTPNTPACDHAGLIIEKVCMPIHVHVHVYMYMILY